MIPFRLQQHISRVQQRLLWKRLGWQLALLHGGCLVAAFLIWMLSFAWPPLGSGLLPVTLLGACVGLGFLIRWNRLNPITDRRVAQHIEAHHPELDGLLLAAVQLPENPPGEPRPYMHRRLLQDATHRAENGSWEQSQPRSQVWLAQGTQILVGLAWILFLLLAPRPVLPEPSAQPSIAQAFEGYVDATLSVDPGDVQLERGTPLVVLARFHGPLPKDVRLVVGETEESERSLVMNRNLEDPTFAITIPNVTEDLAYRVQYDGKRTRRFDVTVFEYPRLVQSDVDLVFPEYTGLPPRRIEKTRRVSAVEGTIMDLDLQFNQPMVSAILRSREGRDHDLTLEVHEEQAHARLARHMLSVPGQFQLELVDRSGRSNNVPHTFVFQVVTNRVPELRLARPRGDVRPSSLEEIEFEGTVWDDFGIERYGISFQVVGEEPQTVELGGPVKGQEKQSFSHLLPLESLELVPDQLISWYVWAEDRGPDGSLRQTAGDLFFAEIRPFEEIFREQENMAGNERESGMGEGEEGGGSNQQLIELQKQIIAATWNLVRRTKPLESPTYADDVAVVQESQDTALEQAEIGLAEADDARSRAEWNGVVSAMEQASEALIRAKETPGELQTALAQEQVAYQALLRMQRRETDVARAQNRGQQGGQRGNNSVSQRQLDQLELTQSENRYETQREARAPQDEARREQLQVLNRLQELARRQQDVNEQLKELQTALQEARTEEEREEVRRRLKRLEEEQQQMLADVDELQQRMERPENQERMSSERQQLAETREGMQRAAEATQQQSVSQALAEGTRAERELEEMRDALRRESSSEFAEDLRTLREEARELDRQQQALAEELRGLNEGRRRSLTDREDRDRLAEQFNQQREQLSELLETARAVSEQAESVEPLLSRALYDTLRRLNQEEAGIVQEFQEALMDRQMLTRDLYDQMQEMEELENGRALAVGAEMLRRGFMEPADAAERRARSGIQELRQGVERAAESVLGDDAQALRLAQAELESLTEQLLREMPQERRRSSPSRATDPNGESDADEPGDEARLARGQQPGESPDGTGTDPDGEPAQGQEPGESRDPSQGQGQGQAQTQAQGPGQGPGQSRDGSPREPGEGAEQPGLAGSDSQEQSPDGSPGGTQQPGEGGQEVAQGRGGSGEPQDVEDSQPGGNGGRGGEGRPGEPGETDNAQQIAGGGAQGGGGRNPDQTRTGGGGGGANIQRSLDAFLPEDWADTGSLQTPLTGDGFGPWSDRLREVEELIDIPDLQNRVATARDQARRMRQAFRERQEKPDWAVVELQIIQPLVEVRQQLREELMRRESTEELVPMDRDPVPQRYAEMVRRYYEALGRE